MSAANEDVTVGLHVVSQADMLRRENFILLVKLLVDKGPSTFEILFVDVGLGGE